MDRLTIKSSMDDGWTLKCMCSFDRDGEIDDEDGCEEYCSLRLEDYEGEVCCHGCGIQEAFSKLAAYEDIGLTPEEIKALQADNERLHKLLEEIEETVLQKSLIHMKGKKHELQKFKRNYSKNTKRIRYDSKGF